MTLIEKVDVLKQIIPGVSAKYMATTESGMAFK